MITIPYHLRNDAFRFYRIAKDSKLPMEKGWNRDCNYPWNSIGMTHHKGNYGVVCGKGQLIVLDYDSEDYYRKTQWHLPRTFTVQTASKKLYHRYYILDGEMFRKVGVDKDGKRVLDIQGAGAGVVGPGSSIGKNIYQVIVNVPLATISKQFLIDMFAVDMKKKIDYKGDASHQPDKVKLAKEIFEKLGIEKTREYHYRCPFHAMNGGGNLTIISTGRIYCFHEQRCWHTIWDFVMEYARLHGDNALFIKALENSKI